MTAPNITIPQEAWIALQDHLLRRYNLRLPDQSVKFCCEVMLRNWPKIKRGYQDKGNGPHWRALSEFNSEPTEGYILPITEEEKT